MVFISHKVDPDHDTALYFKRTLNDLGIDTWVAPESVAAGASFAEAIPRALHRCEKVLLVLTEHALLSRHIVKEIDLAIRYNKEIIPVQIGDFQLTDEFEYLLSGVQIRPWREENKDEILSLFMSSAHVYEIEIKHNPPQKITLIRGDFQKNMDYTIENGLIDIEKTVFAVGIDRTASLEISSTKGIIRDLCRYIGEKYGQSLESLQLLVDEARKEQLMQTDKHKLMEYGDCILIRVPTVSEEKKGEKVPCLQLLLVANSEKKSDFSMTHDLDAVEGIDSREIILKIFNSCMELGERAETIFLGAMGTNGLSFPYEVVTAEIMNAFVYSVKMGKSPFNLFFSVRNEDMEKNGVTSQSIYNYVRSVVAFF